MRYLPQMTTWFSLYTPPPSPPKNSQRMVSGRGRRSGASEGEATQPREKKKKTSAREGKKRARERKEMERHISRPSSQPL